MGQSWRFFNASTREYMSVIDGMKFGEFFWDKQGLLVRSITFPKKQPALDAHISRPPVIHGKGLLSLPMDILLGFVTDNLDTGELAALAVTCRDMYHLCEPMISESLEDSSARWANCRIACVGDYAKFEDFPETFLSASDRAFIEAERSKGVDLEYGGLVNLCGTESWAYEGPNAYWQYDEIRQWLQRFSKADLKMWKLLLGYAFPPERKDWVLCNNTKKEYVRASVIARLAGHPDDLQPFLPRCDIDLGHVLLMRISWSRDKSMSLDIPKGMDLHRGKWVGDRLCITTMDELEEGASECVDESEEGASECRDEPEEGASEWTDVSDEVVRELVQVLELSYGKDWLKALKTIGAPCEGFLPRPPRRPY